MPPLPRRQLGFAFNTISKAENANGNNTPVVLEVFVDFRGREPDHEALLRYSGLI